MASDRVDLLNNAVAFLTDPKTQSSPLAQRVQFLEAKGLTAPEIEHAMRQAAAQNNSAAPMQAYQSPYPPAYGPAPFVPPSQQPWDWRDYFITAVVSGSIAYGAISLARKYLVPHLRPPTSTAYEEDRDALTAQFDAAEAVLKEIQADTAAVKAAVQGQHEKVEKATSDVEAAVKEMRDGEVRARDEIREIRDEINNIREMLPKMIEKNKESQTQTLSELQQELKSLKTLLLSRGPNGSSAPTPHLANFPPRPTIPAWQLASPANSSSASNSLSNPVPNPVFPGITSPSPSTAVEPLTIPVTSKGKGKEREEPEVNGPPPS